MKLVEIIATVALVIAAVASAGCPNEARNDSIRAANEGAKAYGQKQYAIAQSRFNDAVKYVPDKNSPQGLKLQDYQARIREIRGR